MKLKNHTSRQPLPSLTVGGWGWVFVLFSLLLSSCTLSMEEWEIPEEERGHDEVCTVENELGSISYQFADSVLYVTENIQEQYLVRVEADSILYFSDQLPDEWRPYVGMKMAAGISHLLPYGLNSRVISVEDQGTFLRVVTTRTSLEDVYEHLSYSFDGYATAPAIEAEDLDSIDLEDYGYQLRVNPVTGDTTIVDWNDLDIARGDRPAYARRRSLRNTRADDKIEEEKIGKDNVKSQSLLEFSFDTRDLGQLDNADGLMTAIKKGFIENVRAAAAFQTKQSKNGSVYAALKTKICHYSKFHAKRDNDLGIDEEWTDTWNEFSLALEAGYEYSAKGGGQLKPGDPDFGKPDKGFADMVRGFKNGGFKKAISPVKMRKKRFSYLKVRIPLSVSPVPFAILFEGNITPTLELNGSLCLSTTYVSDKVRNGHKIVKGQEPEHYMDKVVEEGHFTAPAPIINGSYKIGVRGRMAAGFEVGAAVGITIGANLEGYFEGNASFKIGVFKGMTNKDGTAKSYVSWHDFSGTPFKFYVDVYGDVTLSVAPFGIDLWERQLTKFLTKRLINIIPETSTGIKYKGVSSSFGAQLGGKYGDSSWDGIGNIYGWYTAYNKHSVLAAIMGSSKYYPAMKLYAGDIKDNKWKWVNRAGGDLYLPSSQWRMVENNEDYAFREITSMSELKKLAGKEVSYAYYVPTYVSFNSDNLLHVDENFNSEAIYGDIDEIMEIKDEAMMVDLATPNITTASAEHLESMDINGTIENGTYVSYDKKGVQKASNSNKAVVRLYSFYTTVIVQGGSFMKGWGLTVYILSPNKKWLMKKVIPVNKLRSGRYTFLFSFYSDWAPVNMVSDEGDNVSKLYFRVTPYWQVEAEGEIMPLEADDKKSTKNFPIDYFKDNDVNYWDVIKKNKGTYGEADNINLTQ